MLHHFGSINKAPCYLSQNNLVLTPGSMKKACSVLIVITASLLSVATVHAATLMFDFGSTTTVTGTNSSLHTVGTRFTDNMWNETFSLFNGDGTAATGITFNLGVGTTNAASRVIDLDPQLAISKALREISSGVYSGTSIGQHRIYGTRTSHPPIGTQIIGLAAGRHDVSIAAPNTNTVGETIMMKKTDNSSLSHSHDGGYNTLRPITVDGDFDNGRIEVVSIDQANRVITTRVPDDTHTQNAEMRFWHMRLRGLTPGELVTIHHNSSVGIHYVYSYDGVEWHRFPTAGIDQLSFRFAEEEVFIAPNIPYPYSRSVDLAHELAANPHVRVSALAMSEEGRAIQMFRITDASTSDIGKRILWIQGRQHAFESPSSLVPEGFARWMASSDPVASEFRQQVVAYVIPILDVDNVFHGMSGKDMADDYNRSWQAEPAPWNAIAAAKALIQDLKNSGHSFVGFVDSHDPYYTQGPQWYVATDRGNWDQFAPLFLEGVVTAGAANRHGMHVEQFSSELPADTLRARDYGYYNFRETADFIALTLESPHHKDSDGAFMTEQGYLQWGEALGRAFLKYLSRG